MATKVPDAVVRTVRVAASPPALKLTRTRSSRAKCAPRTVAGCAAASVRVGFAARAAAGAATARATQQDERESHHGIVPSERLVVFVL